MRVFIWLLPLLAVVATGMPEAVAALPPRPNIVVILADDLGFSDIGCYGGEIHTPNLDALAAHGIRYTQFYNTARCWPTRAALLTGYYAQQVNFDTVPGVSDPESRKRPAWARLLPEYLRELGYRSYHSGKWHLDSSPVRCGFDHSYSRLDYDYNFSPRNHTLDDRPLPPVQLGDGHYSTVAITDHAIDFLKEHHQQHRDQPFFEYVAFVVPHFPLQAPPEDIARCKDRYQVGWDAIRQARWQRIKQSLKLPGELSASEPRIGPPHQAARAHQEFGETEVWYETPWADLTEPQRRFQANKMAIHAAMIERMDHEIGRLVAQLKAMDAYENTLLMFLSDNGASAEILIRGDGHDPTAELGSAKSFLCLGPGWSNAANTPFRRHKTWVHEGGIATPLIAHWPVGIDAHGELRHTVGHVIDLAPTIVHVAGGTWPPRNVAAPVPLPGKDLSPTFERDAHINRDFLWWFHEGNRAIRRGDWKLVSAKNEPWELYDLAHDRAENNDLAAQDAGKVRELSNLWESELRTFQELAGAKPESK